MAHGEEPHIKLYPPIYYPPSQAVTELETFLTAAEFELTNFSPFTKVSIAHVSVG